MNQYLDHPSMHVENIIEATIFYPLHNNILVGWHLLRELLGFI